MVDNVENNGVTIKQWPEEILAAYEAAWNEVVEELAADDPFFQEVWADLEEYREGYATWQQIYLPRN